MSEIGRWVLVVERWAFAFAIIEIPLRATFASRCVRNGPERGRRARWFCRFQFGNDLVDSRCCALDRMRDRATAKRPKSFPISREIHFRNRDVLTLDVPPDID